MMDNYVEIKEKNSYYFKESLGLKFGDLTNICKSYLVDTQSQRIRKCYYTQQYLGFRLSSTIYNRNKNYYLHRNAIIFQYDEHNQLHRVHVLSNRKFDVKITHKIITVQNSIPVAFEDNHGNQWDIKWGIPNIFGMDKLYEKMNLKITKLHFMHLKREEAKKAIQKSGESIRYAAQLEMRSMLAENTTPVITAIQQNPNYNEDNR